MSLLGCARRDSCELAPPSSVAQHDGLSFDGIAAAKGELFAWSEASGLYARRGAEPARRIAERCRGGIALARAERVYLACSQSGSDEGRVLLFALAPESLRVERTVELGRAGRDGRGVALAVDRSGVHVAFHDGSTGVHAIERARVGEQVERVRVSRLGAAASEPMLLVHQQHVYTAFVELELGELRAEQLRAHVFVQRDDEPARKVATSSVHDAAPTLAADARGLVLGYRERARKGARSELFVVRLDAQLRATGSARAIGRANAEGAPTLAHCAGSLTAILPREYGGERFLSVQRIDDELASRGAGHQFYTSGHDFVLGSGACDGDVLALLVADRATPGKPGVDALGLRFQCR